MLTNTHIIVALAGIAANFILGILTLYHSNKVLSATKEASTQAVNAANQSTKAIEEVHKASIATNSNINNQVADLKSTVNSIKTTDNG